MKKIINKKSEYNGIFRVVNKKFSFVTVSAKDKTFDIYVSNKDSNFAIDNDLVLVKVTTEGLGDKHSEGKVIKIIKRNTDTIVGVFNKNKNFGFVTPINKKIYFDIHISSKLFFGAKNNTLVVAKILNKKEKSKNPEGMIVEVLGDANEPNAQILSVVKSFNIRTEFSEDVEKDIKKIKEYMEDSDIKNRRDLRDLKTVTIDGDDAKDLDDAISILKLSNGNYKLYVSIADVANFVKEGSAIDIEARERGNSVYLIDRVIPMLPKILSNGLCSLNEGEDRLTMTCEMEIDNMGNVLKSDIYESVINSNKRMSYKNVHNVLNGEFVDDSYEKLKDEIFLMNELSNILQEKRRRDGSINFDFSESKIEVDENLKPIDIVEYPIYESNKIIESFMVLANYVVAKTFSDMKIPFLYRVHSSCDIEKVKTLSMFLSNYSISLNYDKELSSKKLQEIINGLEGKEYKDVVEKFILRSMSQAKYSTSCDGHFALALKYYTHFTSPIRRYNDLMIHRIIKYVIKNQLDKDKKVYYENILDSISEHISKTERVAIDCERDVTQMKKCEYMEDKVGQIFEGSISGITGFGFYVMLENTVEGLVRIGSLDDYYIFDENRYELVGEHKKNRFAIGMKVRVLLKNVDVELRNIDFEYMEKL